MRKTMSQIAVYAGTFDPVTFGHINLVARAARIFSRVVVAVAENAQKKPLFSLAERTMFARDAFLQYDNVEVAGFKRFKILSFLPLIFL